jgi:hypothetical protein
MKKLIVTTLAIGAVLTSSAEARAARVLAPGDVFGLERQNCIAGWRLTTPTRPHRILIGYAGALEDGPTFDGAGDWQDFEQIGDGFVRLDARGDDRIVFTNLTSRRIRAVVVMGCH